MDTTQQSVVQRKDEISLKELILKIQKWWRYLLSRWLVILIFGLVGGGLGIIFSLFQKPDYIGELTFVVEDSKSNPFSAYAGLASQFGIDLGGGASGSGVFEGDNIMEFLKSRLMIEKTLLGPVVYEGKTLSLADLYIDFMELREKWKGKAGLENLHFPVSSSRKEFFRQQDSILNVIQQAIVKNVLKVEKPDKKLSFIAVTTTSRNEIFSKIFTERLVKEATGFYIDTKTKRNKINVDRLQLQADSLEVLLNRKTYSAAATQDLNFNPAKQVAGVSTELALRDKLVLQTMYGEVVKNLELSKIAMAQETPVIQIVDTPILPLKKKKFGPIKGIALGGFIGGMLIVMILFMRKVYKDIVQS
jgi:hypothetical protein